MELDVRKPISDLEIVSPALPRYFFV